MIVGKDNNKSYSDQSSSESDSEPPQSSPITSNFNINNASPLPTVLLHPGQPVQPLPNNPFFLNQNNSPPNILQGSDFLSPRGGVARPRCASGSQGNQDANRHPPCLPFQVPMVQDYVLPTTFPELLSHPIQRFEPAQLQRGQPAFFCFFFFFFSSLHSFLLLDLPHLAKGSFGIVYTGHVRHVTDAKVVIKDMAVQGEKSVDEWKKELITMR